MRIPLGTTVTLIGLGLAGSAQAHGPSRQKVIANITIQAPAEVVWQRIKAFEDMSWHPAVAGTTATDGSQIGSVRTLQLKGSGSIVELLENYSDAERKLSYRMKNPGPVPVNNYTSTITVTPAGANASTVEWRGAFYRAFLNNDPPPEQNDEAAVNAVTGIYKSGLDALKQSVEGR